MNERACVLIVDDEPAGRDTLEALLQGQGYRLEFAADGPEGLAKAAEVTPDLVLLDVMMPGMDGYEVCRQLRADARLAEVPVILITALSDHETRLEGIEAGADDFVSKPFDSATLRARVRNVVRLNRYRNLLVERATIVHLNQVLRALREVNHITAHEKDPTRLLQGACEVLVKTRDYRLAWVGLIKAGYAQLMTAARAGVNPDDLDHLIQAGAGEIGSGPLGQVIRTRQPVVLHHIADEWSGLSWRRSALEHGYISALAAPMLHSDRLFGVLNVFATSERVFDAEEVDLLTELAGDLAFGLHSLEDETARQRAEATLHSNTRRFQALIEKSVDGVCLIDANGVAQYASPATWRMLGYSMNEFVGRNTLDLIHPDDLSGARSLLARLLKQPGSSRTVQFRFRHKNGGWRWIEAASTNLLAETSVRAIVVNFRDITERKQHERELEALAAMVAALRAAHTRADMLPLILNQLLALLHVDGAVLIMRRPASEALIVALGRGVWEDWTGQHIAPGEGLSGLLATEAASRPYLNNEVGGDPDLAQAEPTLSMRAVAGVPLVAQQQLIGVLCVGRQTDISAHELRLLGTVGDVVANALQRAQVVETLEQRVAERTHELAEANTQLTELDRLKSKFVSDVSQELRAPVSNLKLYVDLLERGKPDKRAQYLDILKQQAGRLAQLVDDILSLSRLKMGEGKTQVAEVDLNALIDTIVAAHQPSADAAGLRLIFKPAVDLPPVCGERNQLAQVITNLIANAIHYTPTGEVRVSSRVDAQQVCIQVSDTGIGIRPEDLPHIFERFYRGQHTDQSNIPGSGLGLAIVKEIVDLYGGRIEVESRLAEGSTFSVYLPTA